MKILPVADGRPIRDEAIYSSDAECSKLASAERGLTLSALSTLPNVIIIRHRFNPESPQCLLYQTQWSVQSLLTKASNANYSGRPIPQHWFSARCAPSVASWASCSFFHAQLPAATCDG